MLRLHQVCKNNFETFFPHIILINMYQILKFVQGQVTWPSCSPQWRRRQRWRRVQRPRWRRVRRPAHRPRPRALQQVRVHHRERRRDHKEGETSPKSINKSQNLVQCPLNKRLLNNLYNAPILLPEWQGLHGQVDQTVTSQKPIILIAYVTGTKTTRFQTRSKHFPALNFKIKEIF